MQGLTKQRGFWQSSAQDAPLCAQALPCRVSPQVSTAEEGQNAKRTPRQRGLWNSGLEARNGERSELKPKAPEPKAP